MMSHSVAWAGDIIAFVLAVFALAKCLQETRRQAARERNETKAIANRPAFDVSRVRPATRAEIEWQEQERWSR